MDVAEYMNKVANWLSVAKGYSRLPGNRLAAGDEPVVPGEYYYALQGRTLVLLKLVDAARWDEQEILAGLDGEFRSLPADPLGGSHDALGEKVTEPFPLRNLA